MRYRFDGGAIDYHIEFVRVKPTVIAAVRGRLNPETFGETIIASLDTVYAFLAAAKIEQRGLNVAVYLDDGDLEVGVQVSARFEPTAKVRCSKTPTGTAAQVIHYGPYALLSQAHTAARDWCTVNGIELAGTSWEVYGHWNDDPRKLRTDVFYLLKASRSLWRLAKESPCWPMSPPPLENLPKPAHRPQLSSASRVIRVEQAGRPGGIGSP